MIALEYTGHTDLIEMQQVDPLMQKLQIQERSCGEGIDVTRARVCMGKRDMSF